MIQTITKTERSINTLYKLISSGHYEGEIGDEKFELCRTKFPVNYRIIGTLNQNEKYEISFDYIFPMNIAAKALFIFGLGVTIISLINQYWIIFSLTILIGLGMFIGYRFKRKKEIDLFTNRFLKLSDQ